MCRPVGQDGTASGTRPVGARAFFVLYYLTRKVVNVTWEPNSLRVKIAVDAQCALTITAICHGTASAKSVELFNARTGELLRRKTFCPGVSDGDATYAFEFSNSVGAAF